MPLIDAFLPSKNGSTVLAVTNVIQHIKLPVGGSLAAANPPNAQGGEYLVLQVEAGGTNIAVFFETGPGANVGGSELCNIVATPTTSMPVRAGQTVCVRRQPGDTHMSVIALGAGPTVFYISVGQGTL
jgi:hypothetical protein